jgi:hypothetical protein
MAYTDNENVEVVGVKPLIHEILTLENERKENCSIEKT